MINIINEILELTGFTTEREKNFASNNKKHMFYVYKNYDNINEFKEKIVEDQDKLYDYITSLENANEIKKNTSFIITIKLNENSERNKIQEKILDLEEDKYFFKKYVVTYLDDEVTSFFQESKKYDSLIEFMECNLNDTNKFESFKINNEISYYSLILKLYIKIPHLYCGDIFNEKEIINLQQNIIEEIEKIKGKEKNINLLEYRNIIVDLNESDFDAYIESIISEIRESERSVFD